MPTILPKVTGSQKIKPINSKKVNTYYPIALRIDQNWQGYGRIKGRVYRNDQPLKYCSLCCFNRTTRALCWEIKTDHNAEYEFKNLSLGLEYFVVAFDDSGEFNAVIKDRVSPKEKVFD